MDRCLPKIKKNNAYLLKLIHVNGCFSLHNRTTTITFTNEIKSKIWKSWTSLPHYLAFHTPCTTCNPNNTIYTLAQQKRCVQEYLHTLDEGYYDIQNIEVSVGHPTIRRSNKLGHSSPTINNIQSTEQRMPEKQRCFRKMNKTNYKWKLLKITFMLNQALLT